MSRFWRLKSHICHQYQSHPLINRGSSGDAPCVGRVTLNVNRPLVTRRVHREPLNSVTMCCVLPNHVGSSKNPTGAKLWIHFLHLQTAWANTQFLKHPLRNITVTQMPPPYFRVVITHWCWRTINLKIFYPAWFTTLVPLWVTNLLSINWNWLSAAIKTIWLSWLPEYGSQVSRWCRQSRCAVTLSAIFVFFRSVIRCKCDLVGGPAGSEASDLICISKVPDYRCENRGIQNKMWLSAQ